MARQAERAEGDLGVPQNTKTTKATPPRPPSRAAQARAEAERRKRNRFLIAAGASAVVVVLIVALVVVKASSGSGSRTVSSAAAGEAPAPPQVVAALAGIPAATLAQSRGAVQTNSPRPITAPPLTEGGKPLVLYVGADYCPFCAAERWAVVTALTHFGQFTNLGVTSSSSSDVYPDTSTFSFYGSSYSSPYLSFTGVETATSTGKPLQHLTPEQEQLERTYNAPPYVASTSAGTIPWINLGGQFVQSGASFDPGVLKDKSLTQIAAAATVPSTAIGKNVQAAAAQLTADLCQLTGGQPATTCSAFGGTGGGR